MALKAVLASNVPNLDLVQENPYSTHLPKGVDLSVKFPKFTVIGHRGNGMNMLQSPDRRMTAIKENSIRSFNTAAKFPIDFIEFDVQVTKDDCPVIFHDNFIITEENGSVSEKRVTELSLSEFLCYGLQKEEGRRGKSLMKKTKDGQVMDWKVEFDDSVCTLKEAFLQVEPSLGFNIELKFDDYVVYQQKDLTHVLQTILKVVFDCAKDRPIIFSSFQPDATKLVRKLQTTYPVFFLTTGGTEIYSDVRRNSLEEAIKVCLEGEMQGIVSEIKGVFRNPGAVAKIKDSDSNLSLLTYGQLNNVAEAVYMQYLMGVDGVIVDFVKDITESVADMIRPAESLDQKEGLESEIKPRFSEKEISFILKLISEF